FLQQPTLAYEHDKANRMSKITGSGSYSGVSNPAYDKAGNQTFAYSSDRGLSYKYSYDHNNRLLAVHDNTGTTRKAAYAYDALGRRIEFINDVTGDTVRYYYDGVNEIVETNASGSELRHYVHGISYVDERLMMMRHDLADSNDDRPYYYVLDRQYNVWMLLDRAGAIVERYAYDPYGRPLIRESAGRGDMNNDTDVNGTDTTRFTNARSGTIWDPRADMDDDGSVNNNDITPFTTAFNTWTESSPTVSQAFSDVDNSFMFQGRPHFALDTDASATSGELMLNDHRARFNDPVIGRWLKRDPLEYNQRTLSSSVRAIGKPFELLQTSKSGPSSSQPETPHLFTGFENQPARFLDPSGLLSTADCKQCISQAQSDPDVKFLTKCAKKTPPGRACPCFGKASCFCCANSAGGWYNPTIFSGDIGLCANNIQSCAGVTNILKHELVHAVTLCRRFFPTTWDGLLMGNNRCQSCISHELLAYEHAGQCSSFTQCLSQAVSSCRLSLSCIGNTINDELWATNNWGPTWPHKNKITKYCNRL
ncbi:MAG: hypothetical protein MI923_23315, partial [Phycisphaerales bacterium]|nr:hypothetical protein [Phycisphaerales bacterium]